MKKNTKIACVIIDDEPVAIDIIKDYIRKVDFLELIGAFRNPISALEFIKNNKVDLLFLDVNMPDQSGIHFLSALDNHPMVVFTTAYSEYAVKSYDFEAVDYLLKPIEFNRFLKAAGRALERLQDKYSRESVCSSKSTRKRSDSILLKSGTELHRVTIRDIKYLKGAGNYIIFVTKNKEIMTLMKMKEAIAILPKDHFFRVHRSYIIAFHHIDVIEREYVKIGKISIPIGDTYKESFFNTIKRI